METFRIALSRNPVSLEVSQCLVGLSKKVLESLRPAVDGVGVGVVPWTHRPALDGEGGWL